MQPPPDNFKRSGQFVYLSTLAEGDYFTFSGKPESIYKVVRKSSVVFGIVLTRHARPDEKRYYPRPKDVPENKVLKILLAPGEREPGKPLVLPNTI